jgi:hypothetical protein
MKAFLILNNKKFIIITFLLTVLLLILSSCQENKEISKENRKYNELLLKEKSSDNAKENNNFNKTEDEIPEAILGTRPASGHAQCQSLIFNVWHFKFQSLNLLQPGKTYFA